MIRLFLRAANAPAFVILVAIGIAIQTSLFNSYPLSYLQPDVVLIAVVWCGLRRSFSEGGTLTLIFAEIAEIHSSAPQGILLLSYIIIFLLVRLSDRILVIPRLSSYVILTLACSILWKFTYLIELRLLGIGANQWKHMLSLLFPGAVMEGVFGIWIYRWLDRFDWHTFKNLRARQALEDEMQLDSEGL